jgi:hypothetical protein
MLLFVMMANGSTMISLPLFALLGTLWTFPTCHAKGVAEIVRLGIGPF